MPFGLDHYDSQEEAILLRLSCDAALDRLTVRQRLVVRWYYWYGYDLAAIARKLNMTRGGASCHLVAARTKLRRQLSEYSP